MADAAPPTSVPRREIAAWAMYDFANSSFATTILTVVFSVYFSKVIVGPAGVTVLGITIPPDAMWAYVVALTMVVILAVAPALGAAADYLGAKRKFLVAFWALGWIATVMLFPAGEGDVLWATAFLMLANIGFSGGNAFYNAFLPELSNDRNIGRISGFAWGLGYLGGGLCLVLNLLMIEQPQWFGLPSEGTMKVRVAVASAGVWWCLFAIPTLLFVRERRAVRAVPVGGALALGYRRLAETMRELPRYRMLLLFLTAYLLYTDGVETVIVMSGVFASETFGMGQAEIIKLFLMVQGVALVGSLAWGTVADRFSRRGTLRVALLYWSALLVWAFFLRSKTEYWVLAAMVGLVLGGTQATSRAMMGLLVPKDRAAEFYGVYAVFEKSAAVLGPLTYGIARQVFGSPQAAILSLAVFFVAGFVLLGFVRDERSGQSAA